MNTTGLTVLVPDDYGLQALGASPKLSPVRYQPGDPWPAEHEDATVVVVGNEKAAEVGTRLAELADLRLIQTLSAGYEKWLAHLPDGVMLSNARGAHGGSTAEWVMAVLLAGYRQLAYFNEQQAQGVWRPRETQTLIGKRVLILGAGDLALNLATRLTPFETHVTLVGRTARPGVHAFSDIDALLPDADVVVAMLPESESTHHIVDAEFLAKMRDGAVVVNAGRGGAVDAAALLAELTSGRLQAALDVTDPEPLPDGHPLWSAPGLILTPHQAGNTAGAWERGWAVAAQQLESFADGDRPPNVVTN